MVVGGWHTLPDAFWGGDLWRVGSTLPAMKKIFATLLGLVSIGTTAMADSSFYNMSVTSIDGSSQSMGQYRDKVLLIVNVASQCGFTSQYAGLEELYKTYKDRGFYVLGFPCNDFGQQEPGSETEIKSFCTNKFGVTFPLFSKVRVLGQERAPIYDYLIRSTGGADVGWNFEKFLVNRSGKVVERFGSNVRPSDESLKAAIEKALS